MTKSKLINFSKVGLAVMAFLPAAASAAAVNPPAVVPLPATGNADIYTVAVNIFNYALTFVGLIALAFLVWGGVQFMMAGGDDSKVTKARTTILNSIIGIVIVLISMGIINYLKVFVTKVN